MSAHDEPTFSPKRLLVISIALLGGVALALLAGGAFAGAAPPSQCGGAIGDPVGDGHHPPEDVVSVYLGESNGRLQAVVKTNFGDFSPQHEDSDVAGFAYIFTAGGQVHYVRGQFPRAGAGTPTYDYGIFNPSAPRFTSQGTTTGETVAAGGSGGTLTLDIPQATSAVQGAVLTNTFVMTYDDSNAILATGEPHWVDRAPGTFTPGEAAFGPDFVVGSCSGTTTTGGTDTTTTGPPRVTGVTLKAKPTKFVGPGRVSITGAVNPPMAVPVLITFKGGPAKSAPTASKADGTFGLTAPVGERMSIRASAGGISSTTLTLTVQSTVKLRIARLKNGGAKFTGQVRPALPGKVQLFFGDDFRSSAKTTTDSKGHFTMTLKKPKPGSYQALFVPSGRRAERSTSNKEVIKK